MAKHMIFPYGIWRNYGSIPYTSHFWILTYYGWIPYTSHFKIPHWNLLMGLNISKKTAKMVMWMGMQPWYSGHMRKMISMPRPPDATFQGNDLNWINYPEVAELLRLVNSNTTHDEFYGGIPRWDSFWLCLQIDSKFTRSGHGRSFSWEATAKELQHSELARCRRHGNDVWGDSVVLQYALSFNMRCPSHQMFGIVCTILNWLHTIQSYPVPSNQTSCNYSRQHRLLAPPDWHFPEILEACGLLWPSSWWWRTTRTALRKGSFFCGFRPSQLWVCSPQSSQSKIDCGFKHCVAWVHLLPLGFKLWTIQMFTMAGFIEPLFKVCSPSNLNILCGWFNDVKHGSFHPNVWPQISPFLGDLIHPWLVLPRGFAARASWRFRGRQSGLGAGQGRAVFRRYRQWPQGLLNRNRMQSQYWWVVWNINFIFPYIGNNHPNWLIFFRGVQTTNQQ